MPAGLKNSAAVPVADERTASATLVARAGAFLTAIYRLGVSGVAVMAAQAIRHQRVNGAAERPGIL